ncbi:MAG: T9SS type A sorting domain-containing protein [candidate division KSB1 bacterium]|nr:T9SS type A sorting domain-containing protein [candidate division KSB1 bacterium]
MSGGWNGATDFNDFAVHKHGFIEVLFNFPGAGIPAQRSGGTYDDRGSHCMRALRDVMQFAMGRQTDSYGYKLDAMLDVQPLYSNAGLCGWSNGGNATITTAGAWGDSLPGLAWIVNWESPVGDGMPTVDAGRKNCLNPAYNPDTGGFDWSQLAYCDTLTPSEGYTGGLYFDIDQDGRYDSNTSDFKVPVYVYKNKLYYSVQMRDAAQAKGISCSPETAAPGLTESFWLWRNGENWIQSAVQANPDLMFIVEAGDQDHVQGAPDHPHILVQTNGFLAAGGRFVRLNPDRSYVREITGGPVPSASDNDAFVVYDRVSIRNALQPRADVSMLSGVTAALCEIADRTFYNDVRPNLTDLTTVNSTPSRPDQFYLEPNYPNPFNSRTTIRFSLAAASEVELTVYDIQGRMVTILKREYLAAGSHSVVWNAESLASGMYLLKLRAGTNYRLEKMSLVK